MEIYNQIKEKVSQGKKQLAILLDPDKSIETIDTLAGRLKQYSPDLIFVGGSLTFNSVDKLVDHLKKITDIPVILFPGNALQFTDKADALLYLSLISGRNAEFLIGQHVTSSYAIKKSGIEVLSTGYILIDGGTPTSVQYMSNTMPIPHDKPEIALSTALAGELLGNKLIYLEAGSGAQKTVSTKMISLIKQNINIPLIVGGGIRNTETVNQVLSAGADIIVIGNILEKEPDLIQQFVKTIKAYND